MISEEAIKATREAMREVTPPRGVSKADWLAEHGAFALIAGAVAAAAPFIRAQAMEDAAATIEAEPPSFASAAYTQQHLAFRLRARAVTERGGE